MGVPLRAVSCSLWMVSIAGTDEQEAFVHRQRVASLRISLLYFAAISLAGSHRSPVRPRRPRTIRRRSASRSRWSPRSVGYLGAQRGPRRWSARRISWRATLTDDEVAQLRRSRRVVQRRGRCRFRRLDLHRRAPQHPGKEKGFSPGTSQRATTTRSGSWGGGSKTGPRSKSAIRRLQAAAADG